MKFSIITVVKNDKFNIERTIKSVINQNFQNFEYILINGLSNDGTTEIIKKYVKKRKIISINQKDKNLFDAINKGIKIARGKYVFLLHSGDFFSSANTLSFFNKKVKKFDIVSSNIQIYRNKSIIRNWNYGAANKLKNDLFKLAHISLFVKRKLISNRNYYDVNYSIASDTDFIFRLFKKDIDYKHYNYLSVFMKADGLSARKSLVLKKIYQDLIIYYKNYNYLFLYYYVKKIFYKIIKLILQKKLNNKFLKKELSKLEKLRY